MPEAISLYRQQKNYLFFLTSSSGQKQVVRGGSDKITLFLSSVQAFEVNAYIKMIVYEPQSMTPTRASMSCTRDDRVSAWLTVSREDTHKD